jgi:L-arabinose isomerase
MGHLYPGMLDVSTDLTLLPATFGSHVEVLEFDDLRVRVEAVTDRETEERMRLARELFTLDSTVVDDDFAWGDVEIDAFQNLEPVKGFVHVAGAHERFDGRGRVQWLASCAAGAGAGMAASFSALALPVRRSPRP